MANIIRTPGIGEHRYFMVHTWFERNRACVEVRDDEDRTLAEWWDEDVAQLAEDGFLVMGKGHDTLAKSAVEYAVHLGLI